MAWYAVWRNQENEVVGFIKDSKDDPDADPADCVAQRWDTEKEAQEAMKGHLLHHSVEIIEL